MLKKENFLLSPEQFIVLLESRVERFHQALKVLLKVLHVTFRKPLLFSHFWAKLQSAVNFHYLVFHTGDCRETEREGSINVTSF